MGSAQKQLRIFTEFMLQSGSKGESWIQLASTPSVLCEPRILTNGRATSRHSCRNLSLNIQKSDVRTPQKLIPQTAALWVWQGGKIPHAKRARMHLIDVETRISQTPKSVVDTGNSIRTIEEKQNPINAESVFEVNEKVPGPGAYAQPHSKIKGTPKIPPIQRQFQSKPAPGPGTFNNTLLSFKKRSASYSMGKEPRKSPFEGTETAERRAASPYASKVQSSFSRKSGIKRPMVLMTRPVDKMLKLL